LSYLPDAGVPRAGLLFGDRVIDLAALTLSGATRDNQGFDSVLSVLDDWPAARAAIGARLAEAEQLPSTVWRELSAVRLTAPILHPGALFCAGANYGDHVREMRGSKPPGPGSKQPFFFLKTSAHSIIGPDAEIRLPEFSTQVDWEAEIGVVIGRPAKNVSVERALEYVAGYLIVNDLSARDYLRREDTPFGFDWVGQKCFDTSCPMGPWITPASLIPDPQDLGIRLWVNDELMQDSNSRHMIFGVAEQIAYLSRHVTLRPGDVIATGTPAGVGRPRGIFLKPGDQVRISIERLGELCNPVVADRA
jgi:2-keto-4-pentenoate hydratase/2-oxohepta-3-ene-1,7-dioic acid hydratase in catechol pathway